MNPFLAPRFALALVAEVASGSAGAAGFQLFEQNASGMGNAYAGSAAIAENASTIFYNPAGMTRLREMGFSTSLIVADINIKFTDQGSNVGALSETGDGGNAGGLALIPSFYLSEKLSEDWYIGVGVEAPFGLRTEYDKPWKGAAQSLMFDIKTVDINPSLAYKVNDALSVGVGVNWQYMLAEYTRQAGSLSWLPPLAETTAHMGLHGSGWGWNAGALLTLSPRSRIGLSYRSSVRQELVGKLKFSGPMEDKDPCVFGATCDRQVASTVTLPDTWIFSSVYGVSERLQLLTDVSWTGWSSIPYVDIVNTETAGLGLLNSTKGSVVQRLETRFRDTWRIALGATYRYKKGFNLKVGMALDQSPVKGTDTRLAALPDSDRLWLTAGFQWKPSKTSALDFGIGKLLTKSSNINNDQTSGEGVLERGVVTGKYNLNALAVGVNYSSNF